jgi:hypothetical protein
MVKRIIRVYIEKSLVDPQTLPNLVDDVRTMFQEHLVKVIFLSANEYSKVLLEQSKLLSRELKISEVVNFFSQIPGFLEAKSQWSSLSTSVEISSKIAEILADLALKHEKLGNDLSGWSYSVNDECTCVTGTLEYFTRGLRLDSDASAWVKNREEVPGFKVSEETINDY